MPFIIVRCTTNPSGIVAMQIHELSFLRENLVPMLELATWHKKVAR